MRKRAGCFAAFDVGGTKTALLLADRDGRPLAGRREPTRAGPPGAETYRDGHAVLEVSRQMIGLLRDALEASGEGPLLGVGVAAAGPLDAGDMRNPPNVGAAARRTSGRPVYVPLAAPPP